MGLEIFSKKFSYYVLMVIRDNPGITKIELMRLEPGNEHTKFMRTQELEKEGLIKYVTEDDDRKQKGQWNCIHMYLTDKGQKVAAYLDKISKELEQQDDESN
jgi:DNA-binding MarR family transcriptional regulator